ncbi:hypothetical protein SNARM312S_04066 [Streptomyces narbonensis]
MMVSISYSTCFMRSSGMPPGKRRCMPRMVSSRNQVVSVYPSGMSNFGMRFFSTNMPSVLICSATRRVLRQPSCQASEESMAYISSVDLR